MRLTLLILGFAAILQSCGGYCESDTDCPDTKICAGYESLFWDGRVCVYSDKDLVLASDTTCTQTEGTCMDMDQDGFAGTGDCNLEFPFLDCNDRREDIYPGVPERCDGIDNNCNEEIDEELEQECYPGPEITLGVGMCQKGVRICENGYWGECTAFISPETENCENINEDNNCDGSVDNIPNYSEECLNSDVMGECRFGT